jgi:predicted transcriptional regulator
VANVFTGERKRFLKRLDYSTDKEGAGVYVKKYHIIQAPALLFLDAQGNVLWMASGELSEKDITEKLSQLGG